MMKVCLRPLEEKCIKRTLYKIMSPLGKGSQGSQGFASLQSYWQLVTVGEEESSSSVVELLLSLTCSRR